MARWGVFAGLAAATAGAAGATNVTTYHGDNLRTGWNPSEIVLTPATVASSSFGLLAQTTVDEQVDGQPLYVAGVSIAGGTHNVVYVVTENNTLYAIDANSGQILLSQNFGTPVPAAVTPGACNNNSNNIGINSTPVIDTKAKAIYLITYTYANSQPSHSIHKVSLQTLQDLVPPVVIAPTARLNNGSTTNFNPATARQRTALLEVGGNIYAGFSSFCDDLPAQTRGWVLGWSNSTLAPLANTDLVNRRAASPTHFFISGVWMSGAGIAADQFNNIYFATGNSDLNGATYNVNSNLEESVVRETDTLGSVRAFFTAPDYKVLDNDDADLAGGGVLLLPNQPGPVPHLLVIAGKVDSMYLLNRDPPGAGGGRAMAVLGSYTDNGCWCAQSYYTGSDGVGRVVESTGGNVMVWTLATSPAPSLSLESTGPNLPYSLSPGFFTSISSNGTQPNTAVIWAVPRPASATMSLYAMNPANGSAQIFSATAGTWPFWEDADANTVPTVADGKVFIGSYQSLAIFGLAAPGRHLTFIPPAPPRLDLVVKHEVRGIVQSIDGNRMRMRTRSGAVLVVDISAYRAAGHPYGPKIGAAVQARGNAYDSAGVLLAKSVLRARAMPWLWGPDH